MIKDAERNAPPSNRIRAALLAGVLGLSLSPLVPVYAPALAQAQQPGPGATPDQQRAYQDEQRRVEEERRRAEEEGARRATEERRRAEEDRVRRAEEEQRNRAPITVQRPANAPASFAPIVAKVREAVVSVRVESGVDRLLRNFGGRDRDNSPNDRDEDGLFGFRFPNPFGGEGPRQPRAPRGQAQGSGFFISADGFVVTNNHVVDRNQKVEVVTEGGDVFQARVVGVDERTDLAVLKVDVKDRAFPHVRFSQANPEVGDWVVAIGNPFGLGGSVTAGIVSASGRDINAGQYDDFIQIDAPINRGNSGGPAFNLDGEVIGINTAIYSPSGGSVGIGFAIPSNVAERVVRDLRQSGAVTRGWLGVSIQPVTQDLAESLSVQANRGALVNEPQAGGPALRAGLRARDVIVSLNGQEIENPRDLSRKVAALEPGARVDIGYVRGGRRETASVELGRLPADQRRASRDERNYDRPSRTTDRLVEQMGLRLESDGRRDEPGVTVAEVERNSPADEKGLREGDVILEIDDATVSNPEDAIRALNDAERANKRVVTFRVRSGDRTRLVAMALRAS